MKNPSFAAVCVAALLAVPVSIAGANSAAASVKLAPHTAEYHLRLSKSLPGSGVADARGTIEYRFEKVCDGWISENRTALSIRSPEGNVFHTAYTFVSWESLDGQEYRYQIRNTRDGNLLEESRGRAVAGAEAKATFSLPEEGTLELPANVRFPTRHLVDLLDAAQTGKMLVASPVFDGSSEHPLALVNTFINNKGVKDGKQNAGLESGPFTPMRLAFFAQPAEGTEPIFEMTIDYAQNGFTNHLVQDYGSFQLTGSLQNATRLAEPDCGLPG